MGDGSGRLAGKVALVTGGNQGIGKAIARRFVQEGAKVMVVARNLEKLARTRAELGADACEAMQADVTVESDLESAVAATVKSLWQSNLIDLRCILEVSRASSPLTCRRPS